jgi:hypothetical protein
LVSGAVKLYSFGRKHPSSDVSSFMRWNECCWPMMHSGLPSSSLAVQSSKSRELHAGRGGSLWLFLSGEDSTSRTSIVMTTSCRLPCSAASAWADADLVAADCYSNCVLAVLVCRGQTLPGNFTSAHDARSTSCLHPFHAPHAAAAAADAPGAAARTSDLMCCEPVTWQIVDQPSGSTRMLFTKSCVSLPPCGSSSILYQHWPWSTEAQR